MLKDGEVIQILVLKGSYNFFCFILEDEDLGDDGDDDAGWLLVA